MMASMSSTSCSMVQKIVCEPPSHLFISLHLLSHHPFFLNTIYFLIQQSVNTKKGWLDINASCLISFEWTRLAICGLHLGLTCYNDDRSL